MQQKLCSMPLQIECFRPHAYDFLNVFVLYQYNLVFVAIFKPLIGPADCVGPISMLMCICVSPSAVNSCLYSPASIIQHLEYL